MKTKLIEANHHSAEELTSRGALAAKRFAAKPTGPTLRSGAHATGIPFPKGLAPVPQPLKPAPSRSSPLPRADIIIMMDTTAESAAAADVLTPGFTATQWYDYAHNYESHFVPLLRKGAPALESKRLGGYLPVTIKGRKALIFKSDLHMSQDAKKLPDGTNSLPLKDMLKQIIQEAEPKWFLTTGTSGGVYCGMHLGDVVVTRAARFICAKDFGKAVFNNKTFRSNWAVPKTMAAAAQKIMQKYASNLTGRGTPPAKNCSCCSDGKHPTDIHFDGQNGIPEFHPVLTVDYFEFGTSTNNLDKLGVAIEEDDAVLGLACSELKNPPKWVSVRNLSDTAVNGKLAESLQKQCAGFGYSHYGYWTSVNSALTAWSIAVGLKG